MHPLNCCGLNRTHFKQVFIIQRQENNKAQNFSNIIVLTLSACTSKEFDVLLLGLLQLSLPTLLVGVCLLKGVWSVIN